MKFVKTRWYTLHRRWYTTDCCVVGALGPKNVGGGLGVGDRDPGRGNRCQKVRHRFKEVRFLMNCRGLVVV